MLLLLSGRTSLCYIQTAVLLLCEPSVSTKYISIKAASNQQYVDGWKTVTATKEIAIHDYIASNFTACINMY